MSSENLDDVLDRLRDLSGLLHDTNNELLPSYRKLMDAWGELEPHWGDANRLEHDQIADDLFQAMERSFHHDLPEICDFLEGRINKLEEYFES